MSETLILVDNNMLSQLYVIVDPATWDVILSSGDGILNRAIMASETSFNFVFECICGQFWIRFVKFL